MSSRIIPVSRSLYLCDAHIGYPDARVDLYGILNALHPAIYPHVRPHLVVFAQLSGGHGEVPFYIEIRRERDDALIRRTVPRTIQFSERVSIIGVATTLEKVRFDDPGVYVVSLFCHNTWVCDTTLSLE